jgi:hypothetical protein
MMDADLLENDREKLRHMLGAGYAKANRGSRNRYVAGDKDIPSMERLAAHGMVVLVPSVNPTSTVRLILE